MKELETIIVSVKCREIWPVSEHKPFDLHHVLTLVVLSKVWTGAPLVSAGFYRGTACLLQYSFTCVTNSPSNQQYNILWKAALALYEAVYENVYTFSPEPESMYERKTLFFLKIRFEEHARREPSCFLKQQSIWPWSLSLPQTDGTGSWKNCPLPQEQWKIQQSLYPKCLVVRGVEDEDNGKGENQEQKRVKMK